MNKSRQGGGNRGSQGHGGGDGRQRGQQGHSKRSDRERRREKGERRGNKGRGDNQKKKPQPLSAERLELLETINVRLRQDDRDRQGAIDSFRQNVRMCPRCNKPIEDISSALTDGASGLPVHFDCVLDILKERNPCKEDETIAYIGQGKFAILTVGGVTADSGVHKHFSIRKTIDWEKPESTGPWREEMADLFSQVV